MTAAGYPPDEFRTRVSVRPRHGQPAKNCFAQNGPPPAPFERVQRRAGGAAFSAVQPAQVAVQVYGQKPDRESDTKLSIIVRPLKYRCNANALCPGPLQHAGADIARRILRAQVAYQDRVRRFRRGDMQPRPVIYWRAVLAFCSDSIANPKCVCLQYVCVYHGNAYYGGPS